MHLSWLWGNHLYNPQRESGCQKASEDAVFFKKKKGGGRSMDTGVDKAQRLAVYIAYIIVKWVRIIKIYSDASQ